MFNNYVYRFKAIFKPLTPSLVDKTLQTLETCCCFIIVANKLLEISVKQILYAKLDFQNKTFKVAKKLNKTVYKNRQILHTDLLMKSYKR